MIDVWGVAANALWVLGLAVLLATWSYASYEASIRKIKVRALFARLGYALALDAGLLLFTAGLAATETRWWARVLWILLSIGIILEAGLRITEHRQQKNTSQNPESS